MESLESIVVHGSLDRYGGKRKCKSNLKRNSSFISKPSCDLSGDISINNNCSPINRRVHFRETIDVFSEGEETVSIPLNDDFTLFPSLRSPLRRFVNKRQRGLRGLMGASDLYMVGDIYSNVPIILLKKSIKTAPNSVDLIAPLATMEDMDLFDDSHEQLLSDWIDDVNDANDLYFYGNDDFSAESESEEVDEVMDFLLRERCLSDEEDLETSLQNSEGSSACEDGEAVIDVVTKEVLEADFFDEPNIEEIESSSSTESVAESDTQYSLCDDGNIAKDMPTDEVLPMNSQIAPLLLSGDPSPLIHEKDITHVDCQQVVHSSPGEGHLPLSSEPTQVGRISILDAVPSSTLYDDRFISTDKNFSIRSTVKSSPNYLARSKSTDFKGGVGGSLTDPDTQISLMVDSGFASLEMADLDSKNEVQTKLMTGNDNIIQEECTRCTNISGSDVSKSIINSWTHISDSSQNRSFLGHSPDSHPQVTEMDLHPTALDKQLYAKLFFSESKNAEFTPRTKFVESEAPGMFVVGQTSKEISDDSILHQNHMVLGEMITCRMEIVPILSWLFQTPE